MILYISISRCFSSNNLPGGAAFYRASRAFPDRLAVVSALPAAPAAAKRAGAGAAH